MNQSLKDIKKEAFRFFGEKKKADFPAVIVKVDKRKGLIIGYHNFHHHKGSFWHEKCVEQARRDYFERYELDHISYQNVNFFLFYDNIELKYGVW